MNETKGAAGYSLRPTFGALSIVLAVLLASALLAVFVGLPRGFLPPGVSGVILSATPTEKVLATQLMVTPSATKFPLTETPTSTATETPTITPIPTLIPRTWTQEEFDKFMFQTGSGYGLLLSGWYLYDGSKLLDEFPCLQDCNYENYEISLEVVVEAFAQNNDANFWCEWACQGVARHFRSNSPSRLGNFYFFQKHFGNKEVEPYCPQFTGDYENFTCDNRVSAVSVPKESYGWSDAVKQEIFRKYYYPIVNDGWSWYPWDLQPEYWTPDGKVNTETIPDSWVCWVIANGSYYYGFPSYMPSEQAKRYGASFHERRLELRAKLNAELGMPTDGNPPLCPGFLGMIEPANLP
jgi:hypothetical protein